MNATGGVCKCIIILIIFSRQRDSGPFNRFHLFQSSGRKSFPRDARVPLHLCDDGRGTDIESAAEEMGGGRSPLFKNSWENKNIR